MTIPLRLLAVGLLLLTFAGPAGADQTLTIPGTGDSQKLLRMLAARFEADHPGARIEIPESIGSSGGIKALLDGRCRLARIARPLKETERDAGVAARIFAVSPVVFMVNPGVEGVAGVTAEEVVALYGGTLTRWEELGGPPGKIYLATREAGDSSRRVLESAIPGFTRVAEAAGKIIYSTPELIATLLAYPQTIGYGPLAMARGTELRVLRFAGVTPSAEAVTGGRYPLVVPFAIAWREEPEGLAKRFIAFLDTPAARELILEYGAIPVAER